MNSVFDMSTIRFNANTLKRKEDKENTFAALRLSAFALNQIQALLFS